MPPYVKVALLVTAFVTVATVARRVGQEEMKATSTVYHVDAFRTNAATNHCTVVVSNDRYTVFGESDDPCHVKPGDKAEVDAIAIQVGGKPKHGDPLASLFNGQQSFSVTEAREIPKSKIAQ